MARPRIRQRWIRQDGTVVETTRREAACIAQLVNAGAAGVTAWDFPTGYRLAAYIHSLKSAGLSIMTAMEAHDGGHHARYVLADPLARLPDEPPGGEQDG